MNLTNLVFLKSTMEQLVHSTSSLFEIKQISSTSKISFFKKIILFFVQPYLKFVSKNTYGVFYPSHTKKLDYFLSVVWKKTRWKATLLYTVSATAVLILFYIKQKNFYPPTSRSLKKQSEVVNALLFSKKYWVRLLAFAVKSHSTLGYYANY